MNSFSQCKAASVDAQVAPERAMCTWHYIRPLQFPPPLLDRPVARALPYVRVRQPPCACTLHGKAMVPATVWGKLRVQLPRKHSGTARCGALEGITRRCLEGRRRYLEGRRVDGGGTTAAQTSQPAETTELVGMSGYVICDQKGGRRGRRRRNGRRS